MVGQEASSPADCGQLGASTEGLGEVLEEYSPLADCQEGNLQSGVCLTDWYVPTYSEDINRSQGDADLQSSHMVRLWSRANSVLPRHDSMHQCLRSLMYCVSHNETYLLHKTLVINEYASVAQTEQPDGKWLLDSGASQHFTPYKSDFISYTKWSEPKILCTANSITKILGAGTVIINISGKANTKHTIRLHEVNYAPGINERLLSLGHFHNDGLKLEGSAEGLRIHQNGRTLVVCKPRFPGSRLYYIESNDFDETAQVLSTITPVDYTLMHQRFAHPSQKVLKHAVKHTKDFPRISFPQNNVEHICKGCAMGKMANRSYPPKTERTTRPFEIVHSDLWSAPIQGYRGNKYVMTFLDDFSSHAWSI
jgi:hypothetical protein